MPTVIALQDYGFEWHLRKDTDKSLVLPGRRAKLYALVRKHISIAADDDGRHGRALTRKLGASHKKTKRRNFPIQFYANSRGHQYFRRTYLRT